jgi:hypothetical protein
MAATLGLGDNIYWILNCLSFSCFMDLNARRTFKPC